jgi:hypothetical protein
MINNKKGLAGESLEIVPYVVLTIIIVFAVGALLGLFITKDFDTTTLETEVFANRLFHSPNSIMLTDNQTNRTYPGIIDMNKFNSETLEKSFIFGEEERFLAFLELHNESFDFNDKREKPFYLLEDNKTLVKTAFYHETDFRRIYPLAFRGVQGPGSGRITGLKIIPVNYYQDNIMKKGSLRIFIIKVN